jgi:hypothetical protein
VAGTSPYWQRLKKKRKQPPSYDGTKSGNLGRYLWDTWVRFDELDLELRDVFGGTRHGLVSYCDGLMEKGNLVFYLWKAVNKAGLMEHCKIS